MTNSSDERGAELRDLFYETSQELLQALNDQALKLEKKPGDEEIVRVIRRTVHTLKGDSAACGLRELSELAHEFEDALSLEGASTQAAVAEIAFGAADVFTDMIATWTKKYEHAPGAASVVQEVVREWFEQQLVEAVMGAKALRDSPEWTMDVLEKAWSQEALTAVVIPRYHVNHAISRGLGSRLGTLKDRVA